MEYSDQPRWKQPRVLLFIMAAAMPFSMGTWMALINNFAIEYAHFDGADMGALQSLREIPGFLSFAVIFLLLIIKEQTLAVAALALLGLGTALTGLLPSFWGLCFTTVLMSVGFHYFETVNQSLQLQWLEKGEAPKVMGKLIAMGSATALVAYGMVYISLEYFGISMSWIYMIGGGITFLLAMAAWSLFPHFPEKVEQRKKLFLKQRYWLYYALVFMSGARRQIFVVFAGFLMVEKFGFSAAEITLMFIANMAINIIVAPLIGKLIARWGERRALTFEYIGLIGVFSTYALVDNALLGASLYIIDHLFFAMAIAVKTYFQKIASPEDIAPTAGISFTINHIAAVIIPASFGLLWLISPSIVFYAGAAMAAISLGLAQLVPNCPVEGSETRITQPALI
ncbi:MFS transporter [Neptunomonas antarctica]|uniref:Predicted arabinose efflux permease, MFS family n=1 Tax=Neptunomonas antarctica TaxID=619304 RepID=A0A1N7PBX2_9GAMM|nr:MFS transporter [Neptunomonas antarctica]SIT08016.1 Predicted arabinose efflux permease, MFS family [Neptunomonas antarctica]